MAALGSALKVASHWCIVNSNILHFIGACSVHCCSVIWAAVFSGLWAVYWLTHCADTLAVPSTM